MERLVFRCAKVMFGVVLAIILVVLLFSNVEYMCQKDFLLPNGALVAFIGLLFILGAAVWVFYREKVRARLNLKPIRWDMLVRMATIVLFFWQCYFTYNIFFVAGWDVGFIVANAQSIANDSSVMSEWHWYFLTYPNNLFITYLYSLILKITNAVGLFAGEYVMMNIVIVNCLINSLSCLLVYQTVSLFSTKKTAVIGYIISVLSVGLSAWTVVCYSDAFALFIPILSFYLYARPCSGKGKESLCRIGAVTLSAVGYFIKPQCAIVLIAILIVEVARLFDGFHVRKLIRPFALLLTIGIAFIGINGFIQYENEKYNFVSDKDKAFGVSHFLMMGLNETGQGVYSEDDVNFSASFDSAEERTAANLKEVAHRLQSMGLSGFLQLMQKKCLTTFNDGTYAWGVEGNFYAVIPENLNNKAAPWLKTVYYDSGNYYPYLSTFQQFIWLLILISAFVGVLAKTDKNHQKPLSILWITLLGLILYEMLFEARARYVYIFAPLLCVLAAMGFRPILSFLLKTRSRLTKNKHRMEKPQ